MDTCQEEEACKGMLLKRFRTRGAPSMLEKREMVSMRKKNRNITLSYRPRIPDLMWWTTAGSSLGIEIIRDSITPELCNIGWGDIVVITKSGSVSSSPSTDVAFAE